MNVRYTVSVPTYEVEQYSILKITISLLVCSDALAHLDKDKLFGTRGIKVAWV